MNEEEREGEIVPMRQKALGVKLAACHTDTCRTLTYVVHAGEEVCPSCGGVGASMAELNRRGVG